MNEGEEDFSSDSDDADYVPSDGEAVSEEENSGEDEDFDEEGAAGKEVKKSRRKKNISKNVLQQARWRKGGIKLDEENANENDDVTEADSQSATLAEEMKKEAEVKKEEQEKKKSDDLWASFLSDVGGPKSSKSTKPSQSSSISKLSKPSGTTASVTSAKSGVEKAAAKPEKVTITKLFDFAGETVKVTKEVEAGSKEAKELEKEKEETEKKEATGVGSSGIKRPGGLGSVLGMINKKPKISVLGKSKLDWDSFKKDEGIGEELQIHNRGKAGYIERQKFLNRTDQRQFEIERDVRLSSSGKR